MKSYIIRLTIENDLFFCSTALFYFFFGFQYEKKNEIWNFSWILILYAHKIN